MFYTSLSTCTIIAFVCICKITVTAQSGNDGIDSSESVHSPDYPNVYAPHTISRSAIASSENNVIFLDKVDTKEESNHDKSSASSSIHDELFAATTESCGGNVTSGNIHSPGYPEPYVGEMNCEYLITTPAGTAVTLDIVKLNLDSDDYIDIYDGPTTSVKRIGRYTNQLHNVHIDASTNQVLVNFVKQSYSGNMYSGFDINFKESESEKCQDQVSGSFGSLLSPGYLIEQYANNLDCDYRITTSTDTAVNLHIVKLDLENNYDYIDIYDGPSNTSALIGKYTNHYAGFDVYATSNEVLVHFHTDVSNNDLGFYISFTERIIDPNCPIFNYGGNSGFITSPLFPERYPDNSDCYYRISTPPNTQITFHALDFDVEAEVDCGKDFVEIFDGSSSWSKTLTKVCGSSTFNDVISSSNDTFVHFHSDADGVVSGFNISYNINPCPNTTEYRGGFGSIYSPGYPLSYYPNNVNCEYNIVTPVGSQVRLQVNYLNLESSSSGCVFDYLNVYEGPVSNNVSLSKLCGTITYTNIEASTNEVNLQFHADVSNVYPGFSITYIANFDKDD